MNKQELRKYITDTYNYDYFAMQLIDNILNYAEGMEENEQYGFLSYMLPIPESIIRKVYY